MKTLSTSLFWSTFLLIIPVLGAFAFLWSGLEGILTKRAPGPDSLELEYAIKS